MGITLILLTYFAYIFIIVMYSVKAIKVARMPLHLRWELYPFAIEVKNEQGSSYYENMEQWKRPHRTVVFKGVLNLLKENFTFGEYFRRNRGYWVGLLTWHVGFILIVIFHVLCFFAAVALINSVSISAASSSGLGRILYYLIFLSGVTSFISGSIGSIGLIIKKISDKDLGIFTLPQNYFNYLFTFFVFLSGFFSWYFVDPNFYGYMEFWKGLLTLNPAAIEIATSIHILLFALFLIYLPFTRSLHYVTKFFAFLWIRWDDKPNLRGGIIERKMGKWLNAPVTWSAPHIQQGRIRAEITSAKNPKTV